ncbi:MAG: unknown protein [Tomato bushy stunt virus satellite RNA C]|nr:MAG: unknown protein [Tomato bushy stunt virus satellite RNA C]
MMLFRRSWIFLSMIFAQLCTKMNRTMYYFLSTTDG